MSGDRITALVGHVCACGNFVVKGSQHRCGALVLLAFAKAKAEA